ncbi:MAG: ferritin family protein [Candidatus Zixiibacteriota bacterium]
MTPVHPDTLAALTAGIQSEVASYVFYLEAAKKTFAAEHKDILEKLALEEKDHFHILERQYDSLVRSEKWISTADILKQKGLPEITEEMSEQHRDLIDEVAKARSLEKILDIAYRLEEEAHDLFASAMKKVTTEEGRKMFGQLSKFEEGHMRMIADMKAAL